MWKTIVKTVRFLLLNILGIPSLLLGVICLTTWLTAIVVVTGTWIIVAVALTGAILIVAVPPGFVLAMIVGYEKERKERKERKRRKRKAEKKRRAARALPITSDHAAPGGEHQ